ncbi:MAG: hypothetical protein AAB906_00915, partial [Patescibacteria group bacterium]
LPYNQIPDENAFNGDTIGPEYKLDEFKEEDICKDIQDWSGVSNFEDLIHQGKKEHFRFDKDGFYITNDNTKHYNHIAMLLSPTQFTGMLVIDNLQFPTISHYMLALLLSNLQSRPDRVNDSGEKIGIKVAHQMLLVQHNMLNRPVDEYNRIFEDVSNFIHAERPEQFIDLDTGGLLYERSKLSEIQVFLQLYVHKAINVKFSTYPYMKHLLHSTIDKQILYIDPQDLFLGTGPIFNEKFNGHNITGEQLMEIRRSSLSEYSKQSLPISDWFHTDLYKRWIIDNVKHIVYILKFICLTFYQNKEFTVNIEFMSNLLNVLYPDYNSKHIKKLSDFDNIVNSEL